jgi:DUF1680 family protein
VSEGLEPLPAGDLVLEGGFWADLQRLNHDVVIDHCEQWMERVGWIANFDRASAGAPFEHAGVEFVDSEVYKLLEAMATEIGRTGDGALEARFTALAERVAAAQDESGYLHTAFGRPWQRPRYSDLEWGHELYCFGHLFQAAAARVRSGRGGVLVEVAGRLADHVHDTFGPAGRVAVCGHPEIELALVELHRALGEPRYLELARLFVERRGTGTLGPIEFGPAYFQDDVPVREAEVLRGHAVRALYLSAGAVDVAVETGDAALLKAVRGQWERTLARRTYLTGGMGARHRDEAFGDDFELPSDRAYAETCAAIASVMLAHRLLLATGDVAFADAIERTLFNAVVCSLREDGRAFFYSNTLHQRTRGETPSEERPHAGAQAGLRAAWFEVSCCPTNLARTLAGLAAMFAGRTGNCLLLHQFADLRVTTALSGRRVEVRMRTGYPEDGEVRVELPSGLPAHATVALRVPAWARGAATLVVGGGEPATTATDVVTIAGPLQPGSVAILRLPLSSRFVTADPHIDALRGQLALEKGPFVLAVEDRDLPDGLTVNDIVLEPAAGVTETDDGALVTVRASAPDEEPWPYHRHPTRPVGPDGTSHRVRFRPYHRWGNRGPTTMRVWTPGSPPAPSGDGSS